MKNAFESTGGLDTVIVPIVSLERLPRMTLAQGAALLSELEVIEAGMTAGAYETYSPEWLKQRFLRAYTLSD